MLCISSAPNSEVAVNSVISIPNRKRFHANEKKNHVNSLAQAHVVIFQENRGFRSVQYSASVANFFDDQNLRPNAPFHPKIKDVVYHGVQSFHLNLLRPYWFISD